MCTSHDSRPPIEPISGAAVDARSITINAEDGAEFRAYLARLIVDDDATTTRETAVSEAERLIALVDGVALQALFDPDSWPPERQLRALDVGLGVTV